MVFQANFFSIESGPRLTSTVVPPSGDFDYIVVGGGLAGSVLTARLSENASKRVLVIETGTASPNNLFVRISGAILKLFQGLARQSAFAPSIENCCPPQALVAVCFHGKDKEFQQRAAHDMSVWRLRTPSLTGAGRPSARPAASAERSSSAAASCWAARPA